MRTFAHFDTDDREHRLLHEETPTPEPVQVETPEPQTEVQSAIETVDTPAAVESAATESVETADADITNAGATLESIDTSGIDGSDPTVEAARSDVMAELAPATGDDNNDGYGPGYPDFAKQQGENTPKEPTQVTDATKTERYPGIGPRGYAYPELASTPGYDKDGYMTTRYWSGDQQTEQPVAVDGFGDTSVEGKPEEMLDVRMTLQDRVLNQFAKSFPGVIVDTYDMPNEYVIHTKDPAVMENVLNQAKEHGLSPVDNGDGTVTVTITGFEKGKGYTGPESNKPSAPAPEMSLEDYEARDIENSKKDNPEPTPAEPEMTLEDYAARDIENSKKDNPEQKYTVEAVPVATDRTADRKAEKAERKAERKADKADAKAEKKAEKAQAKAERKAEKNADTTETKTEQAEQKESSESKETLEHSYEREKAEQKRGQETDKLADVRKGTPNEWATIDNGKNDSSGKPYVYKEGTRTVDGKEQKVVLAYSPLGGVQVMDTSTGEWTFMSSMTPEEQATIQGAEGMDEKGREAVLTAEEQKDPDGFTKRSDQNARNTTMEEDCLKNGKADPTWFEAHKNDPFWKGNEDVRDALAESLGGKSDEGTGGKAELVGGVLPPNAEGTAGNGNAEQTPGELPNDADKPTDTPGKDADTQNEKPDENPEIAELKRQIEELRKAVQDLTERLDKLANGESKTDEGKDEKDKDSEKDEKDKDGKEDDEKKSEKDEKDEDAEKEKDLLTEAERAEKNKEETDTALDELENPQEKDKEDAEAADEKKDGESDVKDVKEAKESNETEKDLRSRLIVEVRNPVPMKTVESLTTEKNDAFDKMKAASTVDIDNAEAKERAQDTKVDGIKDQIRELRQERASQDPEDRINTDVKIAAAETELATEEASLRKLEDNRNTLIKNLETAKDQHNEEITMLGKLKTEWEKTAERSDKKFKEMGEKLITLGDGEVGSIVESIGVQHDGSLGLIMKGNFEPLSSLLQGILNEEELKDLTVNDNPAPALKGVAAYIKSLEAKQEKKAK